jgi:phenylalanyl-tRNA synthetase beta chain
MGIIDVYPGKSEPKTVLLSTQEVKRLSSLKININGILKVLSSLGFECQEADSGSQISVSVPYWRSDIKCSADLVEEVVRIIGYERIPITRLASPLPQQKSRLSPQAQPSNLREELRSILTGFGFQEILTYSLVSLEKLQRHSCNPELKTQALKVANPMTREQEYLRTSLRGSLLATLAHNRRFEQAGMRLFEVGKVFLPRGKDLPEEKEILCAVLSGPRAELSWQTKNEPLDFFDAKGAVETILNQLDLKASFDIGDDENLYPGERADIIVQDEKVGVIGEVHPRVVQAFELSNNVYLIEIDLVRLSSMITWAKEYQPIPRFPSVTRDIALVVDEQIVYQTVQNIIRSSPLATTVTLFDFYRGKQIAEGKKSFAIRVVYQSPSRTLTDEEVDRTQERMLARLHQELGATLRD